MSHRTIQALFAVLPAAGRVLSIPLGLIAVVSGSLWADDSIRIQGSPYTGVNVTKATLPSLIERGGGDFVIFASVAGWIPTPHLGAYNASKFAVIAFAEVLYHENRRSGVRFACVCPPTVDTPMLQQATSNPRFLAEGPRISPEQVVDALERGLERGDFWIFPSRVARLAWRVRRFLPGLVWRNFHRSEGL